MDALKLCRAGTGIRIITEPKSSTWPRRMREFRFRSLLDKNKDATVAEQIFPGAKEAKVSKHIWF